MSKHNQEEWTPTPEGIQTKNQQAYQNRIAQAAEDMGAEVIDQSPGKTELTDDERLRLTSAAHELAYGDAVAASAGGHHPSYRQTTRSEVVTPTWETPEHGVEPAKKQ